VIGAAELDRAVVAGKVELTRPNKRAVGCAHCGRLMQVGAGRRVWLDGHARGFLCQGCCQGVIPC